MSNGGVRIGRGGVTLAVSTTPEKLLRLRYEITSSGIQFYRQPIASSDTPNRRDPINLFETLDGLLSEQNSVLQSRNGHLTLVSLPASPDAAFYNVTLSVLSESGPAGAIAVRSITLNVQRSQPFATSNSLSCRDLNLQLMVSRPTAGVPASLQVTGSMTLVLLGTAVPLSAVLSNGALVFRPTAAVTSLPLNGLGSLDLTTLEVGTSGTDGTGNRWEDLEVLYNFDEGSGNTLLDSAGIRTIDGREQLPLDLEIRSPDRVTRTPTGITVSSGAEIVSAALRTADNSRTAKIITACRRSNALSIEAWVRSASTTIPNTVEAPPRIVTLSVNFQNRNFLLSQGGEASQEGGDFYGVRLRRTGGTGSADFNGLPVLRSRRSSLTTQLSCVVFTRDANGIGRIYVNGVDQTDTNQPVDMSGNFSEWQDSFRLAIANEITLGRPWSGDLQRIAIYSRALSGTEIERSYFPVLRAQVTLANVPAPLSTISVEWRELSDRSQLLYRPTAPLGITPDLQLDRTSLTFELRSGNSTWTATGTTQASLWGLSIGELLPSLVLDASGQPTFSFSRRQTSNTTLTLNELGSLVLGAFELRASPTGWQIPSTGQITFNGLPLPLRGPLPAGWAIADNNLFLTFNPPPPLTLVEQLAFDSVNLRFQRLNGNWTVQGGVGLRLMGATLPLVPSFDADSPNRPFTLTFVANPEQPTQLSDPPGQLYLSRLRLRSAPPGGPVLWVLFLSGFVELTERGLSPRLGTLELGAEGQIVSSSGSTPSSSSGNTPGSSSGGASGSASSSRPSSPSGNPAAQPSLQLQGRSVLKSLEDPLFVGDLQMRGDRFLMTGKFSLFPEGSPLRFHEDAQLEMGPLVQLRLLRPLTINLPDFALLNPQLGLDNGQFTLSGTWLGEPLTLTGRQREGEWIFQGQVQPRLPFSLNLGPIYEPNTAIKLTDFLRSPQSARTSRSLEATVQLEISQGGLLAQLSGQFQAEDAEGQVQEITLPQFTVFSPPPNRNALLGALLQPLDRHADAIIAPQFRQGSSYCFSTAEGRSLLYLSLATGLPAEPIDIPLPLVFAATSGSASDQGALFQLEQTADGCRLTLPGVGKPAEAIATAYRNFLTQLATLENPSKALVPGAIALIKRQIAERLPMSIEQVLYYHYGMDSRAGTQVDLQAGMRLRVDFQNYQDVPPTERTAIAINGFVGSGTSYYHIHSYPDPTTPRQFLLGFDPFITRIPVLIQTNAAREGAGSLIDIQRPGFRFPYYRLFYPQEFSNSSAPRAEQTILLVGAASLTDLETATDQYRRNGTVQPSETRIGFFFRGRVMVIPEIAIFVQEQPVYVSLGTTLRQVIERFRSIPVSAAARQNLSGFQGLLRARRLLHAHVPVPVEADHSFSIQSSATYRFIELEPYLQYANGTDGYDLPVVQGDRFYF